ncbi:RdgB/HAM1 family non-canonical purine NTP pyrophosphatase [Candidatus Woesebacteria bacterium]|nr:RdgB/HAM1 family non-canonical purine NTP pyrophosphatase [Candidatus Woesebacteria bacterium]
MQLLVATTNTHKQQEIAALFVDSTVSLLYPPALESVKTLEVAETGQTFEENALLKARAFAQASGLLSLADDSGLEVVALNNFPGVLSARWFAGSSRERVTALLEKMKGLTDRRASFVTVACLYEPISQKTLFFRGTIAGTIATEMAGDDGFEYDYVFIPTGYTKTFAQLGQAIKNTCSHRAIAFKAAAEYIEKEQQSAQK